jgi:hypothetical protein
MLLKLNYDYFFHVLTGYEGSQTLNITESELLSLYNYHNLRSFDGKTLGKGPQFKNQIVDSALISRLLDLMPTPFCWDEIFVSIIGSRVSIIGEYLDLRC